MFYLNSKQILALWHYGTQDSPPTWRVYTKVLAVCLWLLCIQQQINMTGAEPLSEYLWKQTEAIRNKALYTNFVQGIANGSLNPTAFGSYMVQDAVYCYKAKQSIDMSVSRAPDGELKDYLRKESTNYERYYQVLFLKWHIIDPVGVNMSEACESYADYEYQIAATEDTIYMLVAMLPCMKLWPWLGQQMSSFDHGVYTEWYNAYFDPQYDGYKALDIFVDEADASKTINRTKALQVFTRCMEGEYEFFNSVQPMQLPTTSLPVDDHVTSGSVSCTRWTLIISMYIVYAVMFFTNCVFELSAFL
ncbi:uncharacterized protein LOC110465551 isoform X2 [Mizuhopecten yessoensis]|uniref:uncharacterized protein LOC110465551 isoform X2 n=1 Tax=Mizuhopecten yessoensis TaxID=6573 RepID=UPI000B45DA15|nr:uncharacterized protein LOC110465551 isoform X2 [Mizuhopecten yessoensis]